MCLGDVGLRANGQASKIRERDQVVMLQRHHDQATSAFKAAGWQWGAGDAWTTRHGSFGLAL